MGRGGGSGDDKRKWGMLEDHIYQITKDICGNFNIRGRFLHNRFLNLKLNKAIGLIPFILLLFSKDDLDLLKILEFG